MMSTASRVAEDRHLFCKDIDWHGKNDELYGFSADKVKLVDRLI